MVVIKWAEIWTENYLRIYFPTLTLSSPHKHRIIKIIYNMFKKMSYKYEWHPLEAL